MPRPRSARSSRSNSFVVRLTSYRPLAQRPETAPLGGLKRNQAAFLPRRDSQKVTTDKVGVRGKHPVFSSNTLQREKESDPFAFTLTLPLPPSINHQYATVQGRRVLSSAGRRFKSHVGQEVLYLLAGRRSTFPSLQALDGLRLALDLHFYFVSVMRRDIDGGLKITQDALCEALGINDNRIVAVSLRKNVDTSAPRMEVSLREADSP